MTTTEVERLPLDWTRGDAASALAAADTAREWDRLNQLRGDLVILSARAVSAGLDVFGSGREQLYIARHQGHVVAMLVIEPQGHLQWRTFQPSQLPLGAWVASPELYLRTIGDSLLRRIPGLCLALSVTQIDPQVARRPEDTTRHRCDDYIDTAWLDVEGTFDAYWAARGKNLRQNLRKQRNKLGADGVRTEMRVWHAGADMAAALARYGALESAGWKAGSGTAIHPDNAQGRFYRRLLEESAPIGEARVYEYLFDDRTVAMNLCLFHAGVLIVLKTTYDESIRALSPASLLREEELQALFASHEVQRIEYFGRVMDWHTKLTESRRTLYHLTCYRWQWVARLAQRRRQARANGTSTPIAAAAAGE